MLYKKIVVLCEDLPNPRHSSGELRFWHILRGLNSLTSELLILSKSLHTNLDLSEFNIRPISQLDTHLENTSIVFGEFWFMIEYLRPFKNRGIPIIIDSVDIEFHRRDRQTSLLGNCVDYTADDRRTEIEAYKVADCVITVSQQDSDVIRTIANKIAILPNIFQAQANLPEFSQRKGICFVGSFPHFPNVDGLRWYRDEVLPRIADLPHDFIGIDAPSDIQSMQGFRGWVDDSSGWVKNARICVAPLRFGAGLKGKVLEGLACATPVVTTSVGYEGYDYFDHGQSVVVANSACEMADRIREIYFDEDIWTELSLNGLVLASQFSPKVNQRRLEKILEDTVATHRLALV
ncbi:MAG: glycosyltransferase involved in cell wall biosynthesis [Parasphingorhabdus sp.]|jgi:glycosyltransferase involved in cell wall biosynthesis